MLYAYYVRHSVFFVELKCLSIVATGLCRRVRNSHFVERRVKEMGAARMRAADKHELAEANGQARFPDSTTAYCLLFGTKIFITLLQNTGIDGEVSLPEIDNGTF